MSTKVSPLDPSFSFSATMCHRTATNKTYFSQQRRRMVLNGSRYTNLVAGLKNPIDLAFQTRWIMIFQMPVIAIGVAVATDITQAAGIFCQESNSRHFANIYLRVIMSISLVVSVLSILQMYFLLKKDLAHHNPMLKLTAFKIVVGLTFIQGVSSVPISCLLHNADCSDHLLNSQ
jgi:hypothetical protein